jgi:hypothetical protein
MGPVADIALTLTGTAVIGLIAAILAVLTHRSTAAWTRVRRSERIRVAAGLVVLAVAVLAVRALVGLRVLDQPWAMSVRFAAPLLAALIALPLLLRASAGAPGHETADLSPRTLTSFAARWRLVLLGILVIAAVIVAVTGGLASSPDEQGHRTVHEISAGPMGASIHIYGWYYSVPSLVVLAVLIIATAAALRAIARSPLGEDQAAESRDRRRRTSAVLSIVSGALLVHLGAALGLMAQAAAFTLDASDEFMTVSTGTSFAALAMPLGVLATVASTAGWFLWFGVLVAAVAHPARTRGAEQSRASA